MFSFRHGLDTDKYGVESGIIKIDKWTRVFATWLDPVYENQGFRYTGKVYWKHLKWKDENTLKL